MNRILTVVLALAVLAGCQKPRAEAPAPVASSGVQEVQLTVTDAGFQPGRCPRR